MIGQLRYGLNKIATDRFGSDVFEWGVGLGSRLDLLIRLRTAEWTGRDEISGSTACEPNGREKARRAQHFE